MRIEVMDDAGCWSQLAWHYGDRLERLEPPAKVHLLHLCTGALWKGWDVARSEIRDYRIPTPALIIACALSRDGLLTLINALSASLRCGTVPLPPETNDLQRLPDLRATDVLQETQRALPLSSLQS